MQGLGLPIRKDISSCTVANGLKCAVIGTVSVPIRVRDQIRIINVLLVPSVTHSLILGADFWRTHGIVPDLLCGEWKFSTENPVPSLDCVTTNLTSTQQQQLAKLIDTTFPVCKDGELGCTSLVSHEIVCNDSPIKQRYYPISPAMQKIVDKELDEMLRLGVRPQIH